MFKFLVQLQVAVLISLLSELPSSAQQPSNPQNQARIQQGLRPLPQPGSQPQAGVQPQFLQKQGQPLRRPITKAPSLPSAKRGAPQTCPVQSGESPILILSIDGASVRGLAQFELLKAIQAQVNEGLRKFSESESQGSGVTAYKIPNEDITSIFDFFAGTSAGSVNVGAILIPDDPLKANTAGNVPKPKYSLAELDEKIPDILKAALSSTPLRQLRTLGGLAGTKFTAKNFEEKLQEYAGTSINGKVVQPRMSDLVKPAVITSYDLRERDVMNFSTFEACRVKTPINPCTKQKVDEEELFLLPIDENGYIWNDGNVELYLAIRASSAAPTYFKPSERKLKGKDRALIDAGLFVMSPTLLGWLEAQKLYPNRRMVIISISSGTLKDSRKVDTKGATAGSLPKILKPTIETALEGQQALTHIMMKELPNIDYHRLSFEVGNTEFDDTSEKNLQDLKNAAKKTVASTAFQNAIKAIVDARIERLKKNDLPPFICQAKEQQKQRNAGALPDFSNVLQSVTTLNARRAPLPPALQEQVKQLKKLCTAMKGSDQTKWNQMKCPQVETLP